MWLSGDYDKLRMAAEAAARQTEANNRSQSVSSPAIIAYGASGNAPIPFGASGNNPLVVSATGSSPIVTQAKGFKAMNSPNGPGLGGTQPDLLAQYRDNPLIAAIQGGQ